MGKFVKTGKKVKRQTSKPVSFSTVPHRSKAVENSFSFKTVNGWDYVDRKPAVLNPLQQGWTNNPHFVLSDGSGRARVTLQHSPIASNLVRIFSIQRERTQYIGQPGYWKWSAEAETRESKKFGEKLGMHPSEFLLSEFLFEHREKIRQGLRIILDPNPEQIHLYMALIERFFRKVKRGKGFFYELNHDKKRVKQILEIN